MPRSIFCLLWKNFKWQERLHICKCEIFATWIPSDNVYSLVLKKATEINIAGRSSNGKKFSHNRWPKPIHIYKLHFSNFKFFHYRKNHFRPLLFKGYKEGWKGGMEWQTIYSRVHISLDEVFSKILKKPSIVQK